MRDPDPTPDEAEFFALLSRQIPDVQDWYHQDDDGTLWMCASRDYVRGNSVIATLRVDYDGSSLVGGWSPGFLNWDDGVRARIAGIDTAAPHGIDRLTDSPEHAARAAADWFATHPGPV